MISTDFDGENSCARLDCGHPLENFFEKEIRLIHQVFGTIVKKKGSYLLLRVILRD